MRRRTFLILLSLAALINVVALAVNLSLPSNAAVRARNYRQLAADPEFQRAVRSVVEACNVNVDIGKIKC